MKIGMVGPGLIPIPSPGWGAIETVIWELSVSLRQRGHEVRIVNSTGWVEALKSRPWELDVVHVHWERHLPLWQRLSRTFGFKLVATTHTSEAALPWPSGRRSSLHELRRCKAHLALSPAIAAQIKAQVPNARVVVVPNGVDTSAFVPRRPERGAICLGRWEPRKRQQELWDLLAAAGDIDCDFVGPGGPAAQTSEDGRLRYLGAWSADEVRSLLGLYRVLLLASEGEAHALVTNEAQAAGLGVVATLGASANLQADVPWVRVCALDDSFVNAARLLMLEVDDIRPQIQSHARAALDWRLIADLWEEAVADVTQ